MQVSFKRPNSLLNFRVLFTKQRSRVFKLRLIRRSAPLDDYSAPWSLTFDLRERETIWTDQNKARLVQLIASDQLGISRSDLEQRVEELNILIPDIKSRFANLSPDLLIELLRSIDRVALALLELKKTFPKTDVSAMVARQPNLLLMDIKSIQEEAQRTMNLLDLEDLGTLIEQYPLFLDSSAVEEVLEDLNRLMKGNAKEQLVNQPSLLLSTVKGRKRLGDPADT
eukprot:g666.t1